MSTDDLLTPGHVATVGRVRGVCTAAGIAGALTSMAANMLASDGSVVGLAVGVIAPGAFILASEIASTASSLPRIKGTGPLLATLVLLLVVIGVSAAVVSFGHLREVVSSVGESETAEVLIAIVVDAVAVMGLIGHRLTGLYLHRHHTAVGVKRIADQLAAVEARAEAERQALVEAERAQRRAERSATKATRSNGTRPMGRHGVVVGDDRSLPAAERARVIAAVNPEMTQADIAAVIGRGERTVRRYLADTLAPPNPVEAAEAAAGSGAVSDETSEIETVTDGRTPGLVVV